MPDEKFASDEHDLIQELTAPMPPVAEDSSAEREPVDFPIVLRGYDRLAVDAYVKQIRQELADLRSRGEPDVAVRRALERVGEDVSGILERAHETADKITTQSRSEAEERLEEARREADELTDEAQRELDAARADASEMRAKAERQLGDLDAETDRIWAERHRIVEDTRELANRLLALAETAAQRFPPAEDTESTAVMPAHAIGSEQAEPESPDDE